MTITETQSNEYRNQKKVHTTTLRVQIAAQRAAADRGGRTFAPGLSSTQAATCTSVLAVALATSQTPPCKQ